MDLAAAAEWAPPKGWARYTVIDSHTCGEPFRLVVGGLPEIPGATVLEKRTYAEDHLDHLRQILMWEPRGHADMYGGWVMPPLSADSDLSVLFTHNDGFSTMCGHGIIALTKVAFDTGLIAAVGERPELVIETPAGRVTASAQIVDGQTTAVSFVNVPSFVGELDAIVTVPGYGEVRYDLAYGGAFYAFVDAGLLGLALDDVAGLVAAGSAIKAAVKDSPSVRHPEADDLSFLYGTIFLGPSDRVGVHSRQVCVFAEGEVDRSPTGTGVSARLAILHARGEIRAGETVIMESILGSTFSGRILGTTVVGDVPAVIPEVSGTAHIVGRAEFWVDPSDQLGTGFLVR